MLEDIKNSVDYEMYEVEEYPTWDALEVESRLMILSHIAESVSSPGKDFTLQ